MAESRKFGDVLPGLVLSVLVAAFAIGCQALEAAIFGHILVDGLVVAILAGSIFHTAAGLGLSNIRKRAREARSPRRRKRR